MSLLDILLLIPFSGFSELLRYRRGRQVRPMLGLFVSLVVFIISLGLAAGYQPVVKRATVYQGHGMDP